MVGKGFRKGLLILFVLAVAWGVVLSIGLAYERGHNSGYNEGWNDGTAYGWQGCIEENNLYNRYEGAEWK